MQWAIPFNTCTPPMDDKISQSGFVQGTNETFFRGFFLNIGMCPGVKIAMSRECFKEIKCACRSTQTLTCENEYGLTLLQSYYKNGTETFLLTATFANHLLRFAKANRTQFLAPNVLCETLCMISAIMTISRVCGKWHDYARKHEKTLFHACLFRPGPPFY